ncbi:MAG: hypothetical protein QM703_12355 [Gemmatales bacterium]
MTRIRIKSLLKLLIFLTILALLFLPVIRQVLFPQQHYQLDTIKLGMDFKHDIELVLDYFHTKTDLNTFPIMIKVGDSDYNIDWIKPDILQVQCSNGKIEKIKLNKDKRQHHGIIIVGNGYLGYVLGQY